MSQDDDPPDGDDVPRHKDGRPKKRPTGDYPAGYAKPPEAGTFKKGGPNPSKGRRKGSKNHHHIREAFEQPLRTVAGKKIVAGAALAKTALADAMKSPGPGRRQMLALLAAIEMQGPSGPEPLSPEKQAELDKLRQEAKQAYVDWLQLAATLRHHCILTKGEDGKLGIAPWAKIEGEKRRLERNANPARLDEDPKDPEKYPEDPAK